MNPLLFKDFGGLDAFPCGRDLDQHSITGNAFLFIGCDQLKRLGDRAFRIERQAGIDLGGHATGNNFKNLKAEKDEDAVEDRIGERLAG